MAVMAVVIVFFVRGATFAMASFPITMNDAFLYTENPTHTSVILSNPFCLLRTMGKTKKVLNLNYFDESIAQKLSPTTHRISPGEDFDIDSKTNVVLIVLESFGEAHIKSMSDQFKPGNESYVFTNAYQSGLRSIDALPAIWASIPSFKEHFLSLPNSVASYHALPECMDEMGYQTAFFHGGVRESMGFVSFGKTAGVKQFYSRQEYEAEMGTDDFDGKWGIWDHKFLPYVHKKLNGFKSPFFATVFTLSSHHPYSIPAEFETKFTEGTLPIHRTIRYSDYSLQQFFEGIKNEPWYNNTLFIVTADHGSGADNDKYRKQPNEYAIPLLFFKPNSNFKGKDDRVMQHIDIMPTLLGMLDYDKPYFAFGKDHFDKGESNSHFAVNFSNSAFNFTTDNYYYQFNEKEVTAKFDYRKDPLGKNNLNPGATATDLEAIQRFKAFLQEYYLHVNKRIYITVGEQKAQIVME
jgi:phosphoglycerol transferase MdoB-like AlkP superfamily enzyme